MAGLEEGLTGNQGGPLDAVSGMAKKLAGIGAGMAIGGAAMAGTVAGIALDGSSPMSAGGGAAGGGEGGGGNTYQINITVPAGNDNQGLANLVAREIERIESQKAARQRSRLRDTE